jgi:transposase
MFGISKRGDACLRRILIHGARAAVLHIKLDRAPIGAWLAALDARAPKNVVVVAMANKLARIAWAVLSSGNQGYADVLEDPAEDLFTASVHCTLGNLG